MLYRSFIHLPRVGEARERALWEQGVLSWAHLLAARRLRGFSPEELSLFRRILLRCLDRFHDPHFWIRCLPRRHLWRLMPHFSGTTVYLDIETTGLSFKESHITVVGLYDGQKYQAFIRGQNLEEVPKILPRYQQIITFGGSRFDLPFLKVCFPEIRLPPLHHDLYYLFRRLGLRGGLKRIEVELGLVRPQEIARLDGLAAVRLWFRARLGDQKALETLLAYNQADVINLVTLAQIAWQRLWDQLDTPWGQP